MVRPLLLAAAALALSAAGCTTSRPAADDAAPGRADASAPAPDTLVVELGQTVQHGGHSVRFVDIPEDSRCPANTTCVWEGRARVGLAVDDTPAVLTVPYASQRPDEASRLERPTVTVEVVALTPLPGQGLGREAMRVHLVVAPR